MRENKFCKYENENDLSYIVRMCDNKDIFGLSWKELAKEINDTLGLNYDESAYRKKYQYYKMCQDNDETIKAKDKSYIDELETKKIELRKERNKIQSLRVDINKQLREDSRRELYFEEILRAIEDNRNYTKPIKEYHPLQKSKNEESYILCFSDVHYGKIFKSITNEYDVNIAFNRMIDLLTEVIDLVKEYKISKLTICALGDLIEGMTLRISQLKSLQVGIVDQSIQFATLLIEWLKGLSAYVEIDYYSVMSSNHSQLRPYGSKPTEFVDEDMERVIFAMLEKSLENNPRIKIHTTEEKFQTLNVQGYEIILLHGHEFKDVNNILQNLSWKYKRFFDYAIIGHFHQSGISCVGETPYNNCELIKCPSIMGTDEYADSLNVGSKAGALLLKFTKEQGRRSVEEIRLN